MPPLEKQKFNAVDLGIGQGAGVLVVAKPQWVYV
jgi:hypothetical protein